MSVVEWRTSSVLHVYMALARLFEDAHGRGLRRRQGILMISSRRALRTGRCVEYRKALGEETPHFPGGRISGYATLHNGLTRHKLWPTDATEETFTSGWLLFRSRSAKRYRRQELHTYSWTCGMLSLFVSRGGVESEALSWSLLLPVGSTNLR